MRTVSVRYFEGTSVPQFTAILRNVLYPPASPSKLGIDLCFFTCSRPLYVVFGVTLEPNYGIDNDKNSGGTPEGRILLKCTLTLIFEDLNYAAHTIRV